MCLPAPLTPQVQVRPSAGNDMIKKGSLKKAAFFVGDGLDLLDLDDRASFF
jgi:hypothetical protein